MEIQKFMLIYVVFAVDVAVVVGFFCNANQRNENGFGKFPIYKFNVKSV